MEQRTYQGSIAPETLADYLVQHYNSQEKLRAQKIGQGDTLVVQIGYDHDHHDIRNAITVGIHRAQGSETALVVTMGEQQWITPQVAGYAVMMGLISVMVTPWALFALIWPVSQLLGSRTLPSDVWSTIEVFAAGQGAMAGPTQILTHPHIESSAPAGSALAGSSVPTGSSDGAQTQRLHTNDPSVS